MDRERADLVRAFASLAGRPVDDVEVAVVVERADGMDGASLNALWQRYRRAPGTVDHRSYLALVLRFSELGAEPTQEA